MPSLVLGPLLRYVGENEAVLWVETDSECEVEVLGARERTFCVCDHHYALVCCGDLEPGTWHEYEVKLDGERVWPLDDGSFPPSAFQTYPKDSPLRIVFGSCRVAAPHEPPFTLTKDEDERGREIDALRTLALRMREQDRDERKEDQCRRDPEQEPRAREPHGSLRSQVAASAPSRPSNAQASTTSGANISS